MRTPTRSTAHVADAGSRVSIWQHIRLGLDAFSRYRVALELHRAGALRRKSRKCRRGEASSAGQSLRRRGLAPVATRATTAIATGVGGADHEKPSD